ncbi:hypothetical protein D9M69_586780 [compost metagenome]
MAWITAWLTATRVARARLRHSIWRSACWRLALPRKACRPKARSSAASLSSSSSRSPKASGSLAQMARAPNIWPSTFSGRDRIEAMPWVMAFSRQGLSLGSVRILRVMVGTPVRMAVPVVPRPRSLSAQLMLRESM